VTLLIIIIIFNISVPGILLREHTLVVFDGDVGGVLLDEVGVVELGEGYGSICSSLPLHSEEAIDHIDTFELVCGGCDKGAIIGLVYIG
jgi:hypothetical protein